LADLFEGHIGIYEYVDIRNADEYEIDEQLEGVERLMIEHEAYNKYMNSKWESIFSNENDYHYAHEAQASTLKTRCYTINRMLG